MPEFTIKYEAEFTATVDVEANTQDGAELLAESHATDDAWRRIGMDADLPNLRVTSVKQSYPLPVASTPSADPYPQSDPDSAAYDYDPERDEPPGEEVTGIFVDSDPPGPTGLYLKAEALWGVRIGGKEVGTIVVLDARTANPTFCCALILPNGTRVNVGSAASLMDAHNLITVPYYNLAKP